MADPDFRSIKRRHISLSTTPILKRRKISNNQPNGATRPFTPMEADMADRNGSAAPTGAAIFDEPVSYLDLKAWIAEQEALPQPAPLTDIQKRAILDLKKSIVKTRLSFNLEVADWVSLLMSESYFVSLCFYASSHLLMHYTGYRDAHQDEGCTVEFNDNHENQVGMIGFMCFVSLKVTRDWEPILFPSEENGLMREEATGPFYVPQFTRKKDAKRYAAKSAVEWLMYQKYMPSDCKNVTFKTKSKPAIPQNGQSKPTPRVAGMVPSVIGPQQAPTVPVKSNGLANGNGPLSAPTSISATPSSLVALKLEPTSKSATPSSSTAVKLDSDDGSNGAPLNQDAVSNTENSLAAYLAKPPPARRTTHNKVEVDVHDDSISVHQRIAEMCGRLGIGIPQIVVEPIPNTQDMFHGKAVFPVEAGPVPEHVGRVENSYMRNPTKERVGEQVLEFLFRLQQERNAALEFVLAD